MLSRLVVEIWKHRVVVARHTSQDLDENYEVVAPGNKDQRGQQAVKTGIA